MSAPKKKIRKGQEVAITISEFKQWLAGVEDMQEDGWVPDATQWAKIRAKVELLSEPDVPEFSADPYGGHLISSGVSPHYNIPPFIPAATNQDYSSLSAPGHYPARGYTPSVLEGDGIMIPQQTQFDVQQDHPGMGPNHDTNGFG